MQHTKIIREGLSSLINQNFYNSKPKSIMLNSLQNYQIKEKIGMGSFANVYKAIHKPTNETVAVKVFDKITMTKSQILATCSEVQIHRQLLHSNIARIYQFHQNPQKMYIFMEYCQNGELFHLINEKGPLKQKMACKVFKQILSALKYLKAQRIFHRDIKCQNILFDKNWNAKLIDFGLATRQKQNNFSKTFCGSPSYTAPQIAKKQKYNAQMIDAWCLGVTLYAMVTAHLPFDGETIRDTFQNITTFNYQIKRQFSPQIKQIFEKIFVQSNNRSTFQDLQQTNYYKNGYQILPKYLNPNLDQISIDNNILKKILKQYQINPIDVIESVTKFKLDEKYSLYYIISQKLIQKGFEIKTDILSPCFRKKKKSQSAIKLLKVQSHDKKQGNDSKSKVNNFQSANIHSLEILKDLNPNRYSSQKNILKNPIKNTNTFNKKLVRIDKSSLNLKEPKTQIKKEVFRLRSSIYQSIQIERGNLNIVKKKNLFEYQTLDVFNLIKQRRLKIESSLA